MKLKPSARMNRRYLLLSGGSQQDIEKIVLEYMGILGWAKAAPVFLKSKKGNIILCIKRKMVDDMRAAFEISETKIKILRVSGTLKGLEG